MNKKIIVSSNNKLETKKEKLALNLQNLVNLYIEDRDEWKDITRVQNWILELLKEFNIQFTSNKIVARQKMIELDELYTLLKNFDFRRDTEKLNQKTERFFFSILNHLSD